MYYLAIVGLGVKDEAVDAHMRNKSDSITMAMYSVLKDWRIGQNNRFVAFTNMCDALRKADMESLIDDVLLQENVIDKL